MAATNAALEKARALAVSMGYRLVEKCPCGGGLYGDGSHVYFGVHAKGCPESNE